MAAAEQFEWQLPKTPYQYKGQLTPLSSEACENFHYSYPAYLAMENQAFLEHNNQPAQQEQLTLLAADDCTTQTYTHPVQVEQDESGILYSVDEQHVYQPSETHVESSSSAQESATSTPGSEVDTPNSDTRTRYLSNSGSTPTCLSLNTPTCLSIQLPLSYPQLPHVITPMPQPTQQNVQFPQLITPSLVPRTISHRPAPMPALEPMVTRKRVNKSKIEEEEEDSEEDEEEEEEEGQNGCNRRTSSHGLSCSDIPLDDAEFKRRKLARKAELARLSRKRKKTRLQDLEAEVKRLEDELASVKRQKVKCSAPTSDVSQADAHGSELLHQTVYALCEAAQAGYCENPAEQPEHEQCPLAPLLDQYISIQKKQQQHCQGHVDALNAHIKPVLTLQFLTWIMTQSDKFINDPNSLWSNLWCHQLHISPNSPQYTEILSLRQTLTKQHYYSSELERAYCKFKNVMQKQLVQCNKNMERLRAILTEKQFTKYIEWVEHIGKLMIQA